MKQFKLSNQYTNHVGALALFVALGGAVVSHAAVQKSLVTIPTDVQPGNQVTPTVGEVTVTGKQPLGSPTRYSGTVPEVDLVGGPEDGGGASSVSNPAKSESAPPPPKDNSKATTCAEPATNPATGAPVIIATGEKLKTETDFLAKGLYGLSHARNYRSMPNPNAGIGMFGPNWYSSLAYTKILTAGCTMTADWGCVPSTVNVWNTDGSREFYNLIPGTSDPYLYSASGSTSGGTLAYDPYYRWVLTRDQQAYEYSAAGILQSIKGPLGLSVLFTYASSNPAQLVQVTNSAGKSVSFAWAGNRVNTVTGPNGGQWQYTYNANGMLETVTSPGANPDRRRYHYESPVSWALLTGISFNDIRYSTYAYQSDRRAISSGLAGGEVQDTFTYGTNTTSVTSATGQTTLYTFASANGALRLTNVSRSATVSCSASAATTVYDGIGYIDYTLDWNGNKRPLVV